MQSVSFSAKTRRHIASVALFALLLQVLLPSLRLLSTSAGELRAEAVLATALCSKPSVTLADHVAALLNPWQQHDTKSKTKHCDSCPQSGASIALVLTNDFSVADFVAQIIVAATNVPEIRAHAAAPPPPARAPPYFS